MTTFEITEKPVRTLMTVEDVEVVVGTQYDIALESEIKFLNSTGFFGEPFDRFKYKINKDSLSSVNEGIVQISFETNKSAIPALVNITKDVLLFGSFFFSDEVTPNANYDRITITSISGKGTWYYNGNPITIGQTFFYYLLVSNLYFVLDELGVEDNYAELNWKTGTILETHTGINSLIVNSISDGAELLLSSSNGPIIDIAGVEKYTYFVSIERGKTDAAYKMNIDTAGFPDIGGDEKIEIFERDLPVLTVDNLGVTERVSDLNSSGGSNYVIYIYKLATTIVENNVVLTLTEVDGLIDNVNPLHNTITLLIPITPTP